MKNNKKFQEIRFHTLKTLEARFKETIEIL